MISIGIVGAGGIARAHAGAYQRCRNTELAAFADTNREAAKAASVNYGVKHLSVDALLSDPKIDAISICTPPVSHAPLAIAAIQAGKHVLIEKPVACSDEDVRSIQEASAAAPRLKVMVGHSHRFWPANQKTKELLDSGAIGEILMVRDEILSHEPTPLSALPWRFKREVAGGGVVMDNGIHALDRLRYWLGKEPVSLDARMWTIVPGADVEDAAVIQLHFEPDTLEAQSASAQVYLNRRVPPDAGRCVTEFVGTNGVLKVETWGEVSLLVDEKELERVVVDRTLDAFDFEVRAFAASIAEDVQVPVTVETAATSMKLVLGAYESHRSRRPVEFPRAHV